MCVYVCVMNRTKVACVTKKASHQTKEREVSVVCVLVALSLCFVFFVHTTLAFRPHYTVFVKKEKSSHRANLHLLNEDDCNTLQQ